ECVLWGKWKEKPLGRIRLSNVVKVLRIRFGDESTERMEWKETEKKINKKNGFWRERPTASDPERGRLACPPPFSLLPLVRGELKFHRKKMAEVIDRGSWSGRMEMENKQADLPEPGSGGGERTLSRIPIDGRERKNVVCFELKEEQMDRGEFSKEVLQKTLQKFTPGERDFLSAFPGKTTFEVVFKNRSLYDKCVRNVQKEKEVNQNLKRFLILPLSDRLDKKVNVIMCSEKVEIQDISTWLLQFCKVKTSMQMTDEDGIKNGLYKFDVVLKRESETDRVVHMPPVIQIGVVRGHVFYPEGHKVIDCNTIKCRNCKEEGHSTRQCRRPIICNLCGQEVHAFKDCPVSYANVEGFAPHS
uniref:CCHC-type domain-containing protein n=1 Tax=Erpetoichthys calabaricus TaxID=27687 RepID=A0A8C4TBP0_ERPCA